MFFALEIWQKLLTLVGMGIFLSILVRFFDWKWFRFLCRIWIDIVWIHLLGIYVLIVVPWEYSGMVYLVLGVAYLLLFYLWIGKSVWSVVYRRIFRRLKSKNPSFDIKQRRRFGLLIFVLVMFCLMFWGRSYVGGVGDEVLDGGSATVDNVVLGVSNVAVRVMSGFSESTEIMGVMWDALWSFYDHQEFLAEFGDEEMADEATSIHLVTTTILWSNPISLWVEVVWWLCGVFGWNVVKDSVLTYSVDKNTKLVLLSGYSAEMPLMIEGVRNVTQSSWRIAGQAEWPMDKLWKWVVAVIRTASSLISIASKWYIDLSRPYVNVVRDWVMPELEWLVWKTQELFGL